MLVFSFAVLVLVGALSVVATTTESSYETQTLSTSLSCPGNQTQCPLGCCPYADASCCEDGNYCCPHGETCIPVLGICLKLVGKRKDVALVSSRATPVENLDMGCPSHTTTCGKGCCPLPDGVCCSDRLHCCPHGYRCDVPGKRCVKSSYNTYAVVDVPDLPATTDMKPSEPFKTVRKDPYKSCPGGFRQCPSYMSCCINDEGGWGCCPNPSSPLYKKGNADCCNTWYGYICCPDLMPWCSFIGCI